MAIGYLVVQVFTSRGVIPLEGVSVSVLNERNPAEGIKFFQITDINGKTSPVALETPPIELSQSPNPAVPFATCTIRLDHPDYYTVVVEDVQIFAEQISLQRMEMQPLMENTNRQENVREIDVEPQNL